jgi:hypothetical protein
MIGYFMDWKDELITSKQEAADFLGRQLKALGFPLHADGDGPVTDSGFEYYSQTDGDSGSLFQMDMTLTSGGCVVNRVDAIGKYKGKGLGLMALKCAIGIAYEFFKNSIELLLVRHDGPSFWPTVGALSYSDGYIGHCVSSCVKERKDELDHASLHTLERIIKIAQKKPKAAWQALSQTEIRLANGDHFKKLVFNQMCIGETLIIDMCDPKTRNILKRRLGRIPDFPQPSYLMTKLNELETKRNTLAYNR